MTHEEQLSGLSAKDFELKIHELKELGL